MRPTDAGSESCSGDPQETEMSETTRTPAASGADPNSELFWMRVQAASGLTFALFLSIHLANNLLGTAGPEAYDGFQSGARAFYQNPLVEFVVVLIPLVTHAIASIVRIIRRRRRSLPRPALRTRLHRYSGWFLLVVITGHVSATRGVGFFLDAPAGFGALNFSLTFAPWMFVPYYIALGTCGTYHLVNGFTIATRVFGWRAPGEWLRGNAFWVPVGALAIAFVVSVLSLWGVFFDVDRELWGEFARVYSELLGADVNAL